MTYCRFKDLNDRHTDPVVVRVALSEGCLCFPNDKEQDLCAYHFDKATPLGDMRIVEDYRLLFLSHSID